MAKFLLTTDNTCDLPRELLETAGVAMLSLSYTIGGETYDLSNEMDPHEFYERMRGGEMPTTAQVNPGQAEAFFRDRLREHDTILHLAFSSGLSGTWQSAEIAARAVMEDMPGKKIYVVDTLAASMGEGLMVHYAMKLRDEGAEAAEAAAWLEEHRQNFVHLFTVDDLNHLYRGGRVSRATALLGTMLSMKPILHVDDAGHLVALGKVRGRKNSLVDLVDRMEALIPGHENDVVFISHGDCQADAEFVRDQIRERFGIQSFLINMVGATIGAHSGPGTVALFFMGAHR